MPIDVAARVIANRPLSSDYNVLALAAPAIAAAASPGQFVMLRPGVGGEPLLRRPFSVFEILRDAGGAATGLTVLSKRIGLSTSLIYDAREHAIGLLKDEAAAIGADDVVGIKTHIHDVGGLIEFMAIGTAVKKLPGAKPLSPQLPVQAVIRDKRTWVSVDDLLATQKASSGDGGSSFGFGDSGGGGE